MLPYTISDATSRHLEDAWLNLSRRSARARRFPLRVPVTVDHDNSTQAAQLRDVSARGICFYLESTVTQGSSIGFTLTLPPEITLTESIRCNAKAAWCGWRTDESDGKLAVAAVIEEYEFLPEV